MRGVTYSKLVFLDSQDGVRGAKALRPTFTVPSNDFSVGKLRTIFKHVGIVVDHRLIEIREQALLQSI